MTLYLMLFGVVLIAMLWLFQYFFLDSFYRRHRTAQVNRAAEVLASAADAEEMKNLAERLAAENSVCVLLLDDEMNQLVSVDITRSCLIHKMRQATLRMWCAEAAGQSGAVTREIMIGNGYAASQPEAQAAAPDEDAGRREETSRERYGREGDGAPFGFRFSDFERDMALSLVYARRVTLADGTAGTLLLNTQITPTLSIVSAIRSQLIFITVLVILGVILLAVVISGRVSRPIIETNREAKALARASYRRPKHADDYREIAELNTTLEKAADELGKVEKLQHELIANISHDLRTPLTMISGYAEAMRDIPGENTPENMQTIIDETGRLSTLVNELLDFSRMQTGGVPMNRQPFCLTDAAEEIVRRVGKLVEKDGYTVTFAPAERLWVEADRTRIGQVIYNLVGNALTYTGPDKAVTVTQRLSEGRVRLEIRDSGKGIPPEELPLIWNRYYRTKETHRRAVIGSGLGLNIVQGILEQHGTPYGVDSREGEGTVFWFELDRVEEPAE